MIKKWKNFLFHLLGGKRNRLDGAGKKLVYGDLNDQLFAWYRSRRTDPNNKSIDPADIRREKVTLRHLEKEGRRIAKELNHSAPSSSWYLRFMKRNGLSLQRPKRQHKVPIDEVHRLAKSFFTYNRRVSLCSLQRGPMGVFTSEDISNMDESPLALFGDQAKKSVNDIGGSNDINGCITNKVILLFWRKKEIIDSYHSTLTKCFLRDFQNLLTLTLVYIFKIALNIKCSTILFCYFRDFVQLYSLFLLKINVCHLLYFLKEKEILVSSNVNNIQKVFMFYLQNVL